jgi:hypothetical protein
VITRADLELYAKEYGYLDLPDVEHDAKFWVRVFGKKMFYTDVAGMKEKQAKIAEAAAALEGEGDTSVIKDVPENLGLDAYYLVKDIPADAEEITALTTAEVYEGGPG